MKKLGEQKLRFLLFMDKIYELEKKHNKFIHNIFYIEDEKNKAIADEFLNYMALILKENAEFIKFYEKINWAKLSGELAKYNQEYEFTALKQFVNGFGRYYTIENGKIVYLGCEALNHDATIKEYKNKIESCSEKCFNAIVIPSGECFVSKADHVSLCKFLVSQGVDLNNAVRIDAGHQKDYVTFHICSLYNYGYSINSSQNKYILLTQAQANVIMNAHKNISKIWAKTPDFEKVLRYSHGFRIGIKQEKNNDSIINLKRFERCDTDGTFSAMRYLKDLKDFENSGGTYFFSM